MPLNDQIAGLLENTTSIIQQFDSERQRINQILELSNTNAFFNKNYGFVYTEDLGLISYDDLTIYQDQSSKLNEILQNLLPGQTLVLNTKGIIPILGNVEWPAGITVVGGNIWCGNTARSPGIFTIKGSPLPTQRNTRFIRTIFKRSEWLLNSTDPGIDRKSDIVFDGVHFDGTSSQNTGSAGDTCFKIQQDAFNIHFTGETRINNYAAWAVDINGNNELTQGNLDGVSYLGTGVFITFGPEVAIRNCGGVVDGYGGNGGAIRVRGGCTDGSSVHILGSLLDGCQQALRIDNHNKTSNSSASGGGITVLGTCVRIERCGRNVDTYVPAIYNNRGVISIPNIWGARCDGTPPEDWKFIENISGTIESSFLRVTGLSATQYACHSSGSNSRSFINAITSGGLLLNNETPVSSNGSLRNQIISLRIRITKGTTGWTCQLINTNGTTFKGKSHGVGNLSTTVSGEINIGSGTASSSYVGTGENSIGYLNVNGSTNSLQIVLNRKFESILNVNIARNTTGLFMYCDSQIHISGSALIVFFNDASGAGINLQTVESGRFIEFSATCNIIPLTV